MSGSGCSICLEEANATDFLQALSVCGHVFHTHCLQQWFETFPAGGRVACPYCKTKCDRNKEVHRLYFRFPGQDGGSPVKAGTEIKPLDLYKLEQKLELAADALAIQRERCAELEEQMKAESTRARDHLEKAVALEAARVQEARDKCLLNELLRRSDEEKAKLLERNKILEKDFLANKLVKDLDIGQEGLARASAGQNKADYIQVLEKSLLARNKAYKELLGKCTGLGASLARANEQSKKAAKEVQRLLAQVRESETAAEAAALRTVRAAATRPPTSDSAVQCQLETGPALAHDQPQKEITSGAQDAVDELVWDWQYTQTQPPARAEAPLECLRAETHKQASTSGGVAFPGGVDSGVGSRGLSEGRSDGQDEGWAQDRTERVASAECTKTSFATTAFAASVTPSFGSTVRASLYNNRKPCFGLKLNKLPSSSAHSSFTQAPSLNTFTHPTTEAPPFVGGAEHRVASGFGGAKGDFITSGADGRGGQQKVLKPLLVEARMPLKPLALPRPSKRAKVPLSCGASKLEHFFGHAPSTKTTTHSH